MEDGGPTPASVLVRRNANRRDHLARMEGTPIRVQACLRRSPDVVVAAHEHGGIPPTATYDMWHHPYVVPTNRRAHAHDGLRVFTPAGLLLKEVVTDVDLDHPVIDFGGPLDCEIDLRRLASCHRDSTRMLELRGDVRHTRRMKSQLVVAFRDVVKIKVTKRIYIPDAAGLLAAGAQEVH